MKSKHQLHLYCNEYVTDITVFQCWSDSSELSESTCWSSAASYVLTHYIYRIQCISVCAYGSYSCLCCILCTHNWCTPLQIWVLDTITSNSPTIALLWRQFTASIQESSPDSCLIVGSFSTLVSSSLTRYKLSPPNIRCFNSFSFVFFPIQGTNCSFRRFQQVRTDFKWLPYTCYDVSGRVTVFQLFEPICFATDKKVLVESHGILAVQQICLDLVCLQYPAVTSTKSTCGNQFVPVQK